MQTRLEMSGASPPPPELAAYLPNYSDLLPVYPLYSVFLPFCLFSHLPKNSDYPQILSRASVTTIFIDHCQSRDWCLDRKILSVLRLRSQPNFAILFINRSGRNQNDRRGYGQQPPGQLAAGVARLMWREWESIYRSQNFKRKMSGVGSNGKRTTAHGPFVQMIGNTCISNWRETS